MMNIPERSVQFVSVDGAINKNSETDYGLIFDTVKIGYPEPQIALVDVPYRNGSLDVTDNFGDIKYKNRTINMTFKVPWWSESQIEAHSAFANDINGRRVKIYLSADINNPERMRHFGYSKMLLRRWYYLGRCKVGEAAITDGQWGFSVDATVDPYKYIDTEYFTTKNFSTEQTIKLTNDFMKTLPSFKLSTNGILSFNNSTYSLTANTEYSNSNIVFVKGENVIKVSGSGAASLTVKYRQGRL